MLGWLLPLAVLIIVACSGGASFEGQTLESPDRAPLFTLSDQFGEPIGLSGLAGKVVVLTFLYTHCPDICPLTAETLLRAHKLLEHQAEEVEFVAVTVDPQRDTIRRVYEYSEQKGMLHRWHYLIGTQEELKSIWRAYWLDPRKDDQSLQHDDGGEPSTSDGSKAYAGTETPAYLIGHTAPVFLIDRRGYRRVLFTDLPTDPLPLVRDVRLLLKEDS